MQAVGAEGWRAVAVSAFPSVGRPGPFGHREVFAERLRCVVHSVGQLADPGKKQQGMSFPRDGAITCPGHNSS